jgi:3-methylcrotonyl-CoA carboxylase alpha subunit
MEMNTRLQVEHPVTEAITGEDLVEWQFKVAAGEKLPLTQEEISQRIRARGWAIEARIYAENPARDFMPDSGKLIHLKTPSISDSVRIDAGFVHGDTVSSAYDGMIAKLIVSGPTREITIRKLHAALQQYEVVGLSTNIEFLKKVCQSQAFIRGDVETGYIKKYNDELFAAEHIEQESYAQAALMLLMQEIKAASSTVLAGPHGQELGFGDGSQRTFNFLRVDGPEKDLVRVQLDQKGQKMFNITVNVDGIQQRWHNVICEVAIPTLSTFFPHTRIETTVIIDGDKVTLFQRGKQISLMLAPPKWHEKALGLQATANSVLAPMPCKVLRNEVKEGDVVEKDQALVV